MRRNANECEIAHIAVTILAAVLATGVRPLPAARRLRAPLNKGKTFVALPEIVSDSRRG
jgi:hypothetical protein